MSPQQGEGVAPIEELSPTKRRALVTCLQGGGIIYKRSGTWTSSYTGPHEDHISGVTVADLSRDGLLAITTLHKHASARLTPRGVWFAQAVANHLATSGANITDARIGRVCRSAGLHDVLR
jgi:hypothetical protein